MKCPKCSWHYYCKIYPICDHEIPEERNYIKEGFLRCHDCGSTTHKNAKTLETRQFLFPILKRRTNLMIYFLSLSNCYIIILFFLWFLSFNKVFKTVSRVWFCWEHLLLKYRDSIDHFLELRSAIVLLNSRRFKVVPRAFSACRIEIQMSIRISDDHASICT